MNAKTTTEALLARRERALGPGVPLFYTSPVHIVRGEGVHLFDADGKRYVDMYNNVPCVGHAHPHVVSAMHAQAATLNVHSRYLHEGIVAYAERLLALHDDHLEQAVFACTGTEANEIALTMARVATGGRGIICTDAAYHGNSAEVGKLTHVRKQRDPEIRAIAFPQEYRPLASGLTDAALGAAYLEQVQQAIDGFAKDGVKFAGMLVCPLLANEGLPTIPGNFMQRAAELVRAAGGLFIVDEVQAGFCRSGDWWGYRTMGVTADIVSMGKPMGNGLPFAGVVARSDLVSNYRNATRYFNTFASSPLQAAVGSAVIDVIENENLLENVNTVGANLQSALSRIQHPRIGDVRGHGLFVAVEWVHDRADHNPDRDGAIEVVNALKDRGFLISNAGAHGNVLKVRPPLVFGQEQADAFLAAFNAVIADHA